MVEIIKNRNPNLNEYYITNGHRSYFKFTNKNKFELTSEEKENIKDFCALLFKCLYILHREFELDFDLIHWNIQYLFNFEYHDKGEYGGKLYVNI